MLFVHQAEALAYVSEIADETERVILEAALAISSSYVVRQPTMKSFLAENPLDLRVFVEVIHALLRKKPLFEELFRGKYSSFEDACERLGLF